MAAEHERRATVHESDLLPPREAPSRSRYAVVAIAGVSATLAWHYLRPVPWTWTLLIAFIPVAIRAKNIAALHLAILAALNLGVPRLLPTAPSIFMAKGAALAAYGAVCLMVAPLRVDVAGFSIGTIMRRTWFSAAVFLVGFAGFTAWYLAHYRPPASRLLVAETEMPTLLFIVLGAAINALAEEVFWRGAMQAALKTILPARSLVVLAQAAHFGLAHYRGPFFSGWAGVAGATLMGGVLGNFRWRTGALFVPWLLHLSCDIVILALAAHDAARPG